MRTRLILHPDRAGAKGLRERDEEWSVCVRCWYDETMKKQWKTVKLIIEKRVWDPPPPKGQADTLVDVQVAAQEREVRQQVKGAGGKWNPQGVV